MRRGRLCAGRPRSAAPAGTRTRTPCHCRSLAKEAEPLWARPPRPGNPHRPSVPATRRDRRCVPRGPRRSGSRPSRVPGGCGPPTGPPLPAPGSGGGSAPVRMPKAPVPWTPGPRTSGNSSPTPSCCRRPPQRSAEPRPSRPTPAVSRARRPRIHGRKRRSLLATPVGAAGSTTETRRSAARRGPLSPFHGGPRSRRRAAAHVRGAPRATAAGIREVRRDLVGQRLGHRTGGRGTRRGPAGAGQDVCRPGERGRHHRHPGLVLAYVQGSRSRPYRVQVRLRTFSDDEWHIFLDAAAERPGHIAALLDKQVPQSLADAGSGCCPCRETSNRTAAAPTPAVPASTRPPSATRPRVCSTGTPLYCFCCAAGANGSCSTRCPGAMRRARPGPSRTGNQHPCPAYAPGTPLRGTRCRRSRCRCRRPPTRSSRRSTPGRRAARTRSRWTSWPRTRPPVHTPADHGTRPGRGADPVAGRRTARLRPTGFGTHRGHPGAVRLPGRRHRTHSGRSGAGGRGMAAGRTGGTRRTGGALGPAGGPLRPCPPLLLAADLPAFRPWRNRLTHPDGHVQLRLGQDGLWYVYESEPGREEWWPRGTPDLDPVGALTGLGRGRPRRTSGGAGREGRRRAVLPRVRNPSAPRNGLSRIAECSQLRSVRSKSPWSRAAPEPWTRCTTPPGSPGAWRTSGTGGSGTPSTTTPRRSGRSRRSC